MLRHSANTTEAVRRPGRVAASTVAILATVGLAIVVAHAAETPGAVPTGSAAKATEAPRVDPKEVALARGKQLSHLPTEEVFSLKQRRQRLDAREEAVADRERQLATLRDALDQRLNRLATLQRRMEDYLNRFKKQEETNLGQLVKVVQSMRPDAAAASLSQMDERLATLVLARMNEKKAAKIMNVLPPSKAVLLASRMGESGVGGKKR